MILPTFQAQSPAISGYSLGWLSCTAFSAAMAAQFDRQKFVCTGEQVRRLTGDTTGGLTLAQVDAALLEGWGVNLNTVYRLPWADFARAINAGKGAILQGGYGPIAESRFDAGRGFRGNHAIKVAPGWIGMDPLADGRYGEAYKYHAEPYPQSLLRAFAAKLNLGDRLLGDGYVYASLTRDNVADYQVTIRPLAGQTTRDYTRYFVTSGRITGHENRRTKGFQAPCSAPANLLTQSGNARVSLVQIRKAGSPYDGWWVSSRWSQEV